MRVPSMCPSIHALTFVLNGRQHLRYFTISELRMLSMPCKSAARGLAPLQLTDLEQRAAHVARDNTRLAGLLEDERAAREHLEDMVGVSGSACLVFCLPTFCHYR